MRYLAILVLMVWSCTDFIQSALLIQYAVDYQYYVEVLCREADKPESECNGTCHLNEQLASTQESSDEPGTPGYERLEVEVPIGDIQSLNTQCDRMIAVNQRPIVSLMVDQWEKEPEIHPPNV